MDKQHKINWLNLLNVFMNPNFSLKHSKFLNNEPNTMLNVSDTKFFLLDPNIIKLLSPNHTKNTIGKRNLPFEKMAILNDFFINDTLIHGIFIAKAFDCENNYDEVTMCNFLLDKNIYKFTLHDTTINTDPSETDKLNKEEIKLISNLRTFVCNILDFMNNPDAEFIEYNKPSERLESQMNHNKINYIYVRVTGKLKIYMDYLKKENSFEYGHKFWVRGHFRRFKSPKYKDKVGQKIWIVPYIKGTGHLINKIYQVSDK
jgi:hypothetical protein